jgi:hypothetical protein
LVVPSEIDPLRDLLQRSLPLRLPGCRLALASEGRDSPVWVDEDGYLFVAITLTSFDPADGEEVSGYKEQELCFGTFAEHSPERWQAFFAGTMRALPSIFEQLGCEPEALMPHELFENREVLEQPAWASSDDFAKALSDPEQLAAWNLARLDAQWREQLEPCGLQDQGEAVRALVRPALRLLLERDEDEEDEQDEQEPRPTGDSRLGGCPDLPPTQSWPEVDGTPLVFVAQLDLAALARHPGASELPDHGLLSFFYDPMSLGNCLSHSVCVLHLTDMQALVRRPVPESVPRLRPHWIELAAERQVPGIESYYFYESLVPEPQRPIDFQALANLVFQISEADHERPIHQLLGCAAAIQGDPYLDVEISTREQGWDDWQDGSPQAQQLRARALHWRLLLQIDAVQDDELLLNQDGGFFYFWIPDDALAARDWSRARGALQCH